MRTLSGCGTALITPFTSNYEVDYNSFRSLINRQLEANIDFLVPLGTTGETPSLEEYEKEKIMDLIVEINDDRVPIVVGAGSNCTKEVIKNISRLSRYNPFAFLIVVPYYNKPTQQGIYEHYRAISESTSANIVLYNVPGRTGVNMSADTTLRLAQLANIIAIKEASGNYYQISEIIRMAPDGFTVLSGNDDETLSLMSTGAKGVISVASNIAPKPMVHMVEHLLKGEITEAAHIHHRMMPLFKGCFVESNPIPAKSALSIMGLIENRLRLPLTCSSLETDTLMNKLINELCYDF